MEVPAVHGVIARRLLVNYRGDPAAIARMLPPPFRPKLVDGYAVAGICLIRLSEIRPRGFPSVLVWDQRTRRIALRSNGSRTA